MGHEKEPGIFPPDEPVTKPDHRRGAKYRDETERFLAESLRAEARPRWRRRPHLFAVTVLIFVLATIVWTLAVLLSRTAAP